MQLASTKQISSGDIRQVEYDIFVAATGYEKRATNSLRYLDCSKIKCRYVYAFKDRKNHIRAINDEIFNHIKPMFIEVDGDDGQLVRETIIKCINEVSSNRVRMFVDYSSMTRSWYAAIISALQIVKGKVEVQCHFAYSPSVFESPQPPTPNQSASPIPGFCGLDAVDRPTALVVGLGYEKDRALGLLEYIDPATCFAFVTDPPLDERYLQALKKNNSSFLKLIGRDNQYLHPLDDLQRISTLLLSLVWGLKDYYRVILAPMGVKPFALMCLLLATRYPELDVWRVTGGARASTHLREALGIMYVLSADFIS